MFQIIKTDGLPIKSWCGQPEQGAIEQAKNLARLPFAYRHIALMPDTHEGYGMPIGGVLAAHGVVVPYAVGVDIGCGMLAMQTCLTEIGTDEIKKIFGSVREAVPLGFKHHDTPRDLAAPPDEAVIARREYDSAKHQLGTLGGGNHFIEIQKGSDGHIWFMVHTGSRNLGKKTCDYHNETARNLNARWHSAVPKEWQLAFLPADTDEGRAYIADMQYCQQFALKNREAIAEKIAAAFESALGGGAVAADAPTYNVHHNYAQLENHFGQNVWVHRKGATSAKDGEIGIIPGSQGTKSYIVTGLGNRESFMSCSHGAGRIMGRKEAQRTLSLENEKKRLDEQGIVHGLRNTRDLDEAAGAYKNIDTVMAEQNDLVTVKVELMPLGVIKG